MIVIWLICIVVLILIAYFLAHRSMKDYQDDPPGHLNYSLYLIRSPGAFTVEFLQQLAERSKQPELVVSFERLFKGNSTALVVYAPKDLIEQFDHLNLLELEDYTQKVNLTNCLAWEIGPKTKVHSKDMSLGSPPTFLKNLNLSDRDQLYFQSVCQILTKNKKTFIFQVTLRGVVISEDPILRAKIAKEIDTRMSNQTKFQGKEKTRSSSQIYYSYKKRQIVPKAVIPFTMRSEDLVSLLTQ